ncbi:sugar ABC transporter ATP-binding protein [Neorhodopirellula pilleata]|uniref:Ribose import ATP-binding protein RbsA n=1 Tax=Neorhodopirellula pilleata TaxID=2714738 RepID=A0A5C6A8A2_9BACT|nr:sugar ABC transporter ATP-binding protein [Neorhodopirellula pilleata]TWT95610.1 Ribose import ATP-binding protein RbsA [Neorhodopirellula pilleata]
MSITPSNPDRLRLTAITKSFGATHALAGVDLAVGRGEVHAIIGENGAGKSTLMKVLSGAHRPDSGSIELDGEIVTLADPRQSQAAGIAMIYQELNLAPDLSVVENITLGSEPNRRCWGRKTGWVDRAAQRTLAIAALQKLNCPDLPLDRPIRELSIAQQQMIEIARAVVTSAGTATKLKLLILDEPTSSLTQNDTEHLFNVIERLKSEGVSVLYISHFLEECQRIADRFTVLRDGRSVGTGRIGEDSPQNNERSEAGTDASAEPITPMDEIIRMMVGRNVSELYPHFRHQRGDVAIELDGVSGPELPESVALKVRHGQIFGIAGLIGAGRTETLRAVFGLDKLKSGRVVIHGRAATTRSPRSSWMDDSIGLVSEDRKNEGLFLTRSLSDNLTITRAGDYGRAGFVSTAKMESATRYWMKQLDVKASGPEQAIGELSGGNQQKIAFGRLLHHDCDILLLDEPTRGIDIGSKETIYRQIGELAAQGKAIVLVSSYLPELMGVCDTIAVFSKGRLIEVREADQWTEHELLTAAI